MGSCCIAQGAQLGAPWLPRRVGRGKREVVQEGRNIEGARYYFHCLKNGKKEMWTKLDYQFNASIKTSSLLGTKQGNETIENYNSCVAIETLIYHCVLVSCGRLFATPCAIACEVPQSMEFSRQAHWSGRPCPPPGHLPNPRIEPVSLVSPALAGGLFTTGATWETLITLYNFKSIHLFSRTRS